MAVTTIGGIPVFKAYIDEEGGGMERISLVTDPAVDYDFLKFGRERRPVQLSVADEERRLIYGVIMRANMPIYRFDLSWGEYFILFTPELIRAMAEKYIAEGRANAFNLQHEDGSDVEGVQMVQWFIKDSARGVSPAEFPDVEDGSLFGEFHVTDDGVWAGIKAGEFRGFSLEGSFGMEPSEGILSTEKVTEDVREYLDNFKNKHKNMAKMNRIKAALARYVQRVQMGSISTDKGVLFWDGDGELEVGFNVYTENEEGERVAAPAGEYVIEGDLVVIVADGQVTEIRDVEDPAEQQPEAPAAEPEQQAQAVSIKQAIQRLAQRFGETYSEKVEAIREAIAATGVEDFWIIEAADDFAVAEVWDENGGSKYVRYAITGWSEDGKPTLGENEEVQPAFVTDEQKAAIEQENNAAQEEMARKDARIAELEKQVAEYAKTPAGAPAHEAAKAAERRAGNGGTSLQKAIKYARNR